MTSQRVIGVRSSSQMHSTGCILTWPSLLPYFTPTPHPSLLPHRLAPLNEGGIQKPLLFRLCFWRTPCSSTFYFPFRQRHKSIPFFVICEKGKVLRSQPHKYFRPFPEGDFNSCKDLEARDIFRKPFNHTFQFRSH